MASRPDGRSALNREGDSRGLSACESPGHQTALRGVKAVPGSTYPETIVLKSTRPIGAVTLLDARKDAYTLGTLSSRNPRFSSPA
jgi:hypothetical protein